MVKRGERARNFYQSFFTTDFSVIKRTSITEKQNVEFRADFFSVFSNVNFNISIANNIGNPPIMAQISAGYIRCAATRASFSSPCVIISKGRRRRRLP
ncbi:MAG TPA: hypothetical protein VM943_09670 [Pyrinomonadaceae bacterium]|nr:hypothetical protein [Pyrinomonadaceae bacterium]